MVLGASQHQNRNMLDVSCPAQNTEIGLVQLSIHKVKDRQGIHTDCISISTQPHERCLTDHMTANVRM